MAYGETHVMSHTSTTTTTQAFGPRVTTVVCCPSVCARGRTEAGSHVGSSRRWELRSEAEKGATPPLISASRADGGRDGCRGGKAPLQGTDDRHSHQ